MEKLISFFTHNPFILIIIVGLLYSMFFRKSPIEKPPNRPGSRPGNGPNRMPNFGGSPVFAPKQQSGMDDPAPQPVFAEGPILQAPAPASPFEMPRTPSYSLQERTEPSRREEARPAPARARWTPQAPEETIVAHAASDRGRIALTPDDLTRAVVWAEVLGPPRAKRPYNRR